MNGLPLPTADCGSAVAQADEEMGEINLYDIYVEQCERQAEGEHHFGSGALSVGRR